ncbi:MAG: hypothetical protein HN867_00980 [Deltaproteobacteria bacterium]|jgi:hypothetical protein|nr:hypothetical protein [Deltaproteobacteria bacterium]MBT7202051.1 hypothetical protein [Deltaproteobacteria bacterium]
MGFVLHNSKEVETLHSCNDEPGFYDIFLLHDFSGKSAEGIHEKLQHYLGDFYGDGLLK